MPVVTHCETESAQRGGIRGHSVITDVSTHHRLQPLPQFRDGIMHAPQEFGLDLLQLCLQTFADRLPYYRVPSLTRFPANVRESEKVECFGFPFAALLPVASRKAAKLQKLRFLRV